MNTLLAEGTHAESVEVQEAGCGFLSSVAHGWAEGRDHVAAAGGRTAAQRAMSTHRTHARIYTYTLSHTQSWLHRTGGNVREALER